MRYVMFLSLVAAAWGMEAWAQQIPGALPAPIEAQAPPPTPVPPPAEAEAPPPTQISPPPMPVPPPPMPYPAPLPYPPPPMFVGPPAAVMVRPPCDPCIWFDVQGLLWWVKNPPLPVPLLTTGPASEGLTAGNLGAPGTTSLDSHLNYGAEGGVSLELGGWIDRDRTAGVEGGAFFLQQQTTSFGVGDRSGTGAFVINEPVAGAPFTTQVSAPGFDTGNAQVYSTMRFWGADLNGIVNVCRTDGWTVNLLGGFRYLGLSETLGIGNSSTLLTTVNFTDGGGNVILSAPPGSIMSELDIFHTRNDFYGGQLGGHVDYTMGQWFVSGIGKCAVGVTHEQVSIEGNTVVNPVNGSPQFFSAGNYATTNSGVFSQNRFAVAPEIQANVGYQYGPCVRFWVGYEFLYWSSVLRPGNQIDNTFDGVTHPVVPMVASPFWAQGVNFGLQLKF